jgi:hypothetical protein
MPSVLPPHTTPTAAFLSWRCRPGPAVSTATRIAVTLSLGWTYLVRKAGRVALTEQSKLRGVEDQEGRGDMRVMLMIKGDPEPGAAPSEELLAAMGRYNDELKTAGVLLDLAGLLPSAEGRRVKFAGGDRTVIDGPFPESKQLIAGYWILQVPSMDEAVEWAKRAPFEALSRIYPGEYGATGEIEIRRVFELEGLDASS